MRSTRPSEISRHLARRETHAATAHDEPLRAGDVLPMQQKNPHAAALGRLGGLKGGRARAISLSATKRREIARKAARARWRKQKA